MIGSKILPKVDLSSEEMRERIKSGILLSKKERVIGSFIRKAKSEIPMIPNNPERVRKYIIRPDKPFKLELEWNKNSKNAKKYSFNDKKIERIDKDNLFYQLTSLDPLY